MPSAVIHAQALDGTWERIGTGRSAGITPQDVNLTANEWGSDTASFVLRRDPGAVYPDLLAFTPIFVTIGGVKKWAGRIEETPTRDGSEQQISVQARGWQYHLDDDLYVPGFVHTRLSDWKDWRSHIDANLARFTTACQIEVGDGLISLTFPQGVATNNGGMVYLDAGEGKTFERVIAQWEISAGTNNRAVYFISADTPTDFNGTSGGTLIHSSTSAGSGTFRKTLATPRRYIGFLHDANAHSPSADEVFKLTSIKAFADADYESGDESVVTADVMFKDALERGTYSFSSDVSGVEAQTFAVPDYAPNDYVTPRTVAEVAKELEDAVVMIDVDRRAILKDKPQRPKFRVGRWSGSEFNDASAGSAGGIYNRALVGGTGPDGQPLVVQRLAAHQLDAQRIAQATPAVDNPSFDVDISDWSATGGLSLSRLTSGYDSAPAMMRCLFTALTTTGVCEGTITGDFRRGSTYLVSLRFQTSVSVSSATLFWRMKFGVENDFGYQLIPYDNASWTTLELVWSPQADTSSAKLTLDFNKTTGSAAIAHEFYIDSISPVHVVVPTLADRRAFVRTVEHNVSSGLIEELGTQIGDVFMANHMTTPFKGDLEIEPGGVRELIGGRDVHPSDLLLNTSEQILFSHMVDPDSGAVGRSGRIVSVSYDDNEEKGRVAIDNESKRLDALLARMKMAVGS